MTAPDNCPFHAVDRNATVWVNSLPYSAELACETWHDTVPVRAAMQNVFRNLRGEQFWADQHVG